MVGVAGVAGMSGQCVRPPCAACIAHLIPEEDRCLGCATVDLSPLGYGMPLLSGWYNVGDFAGQCVGQLQVGGAWVDWRVVLCDPLIPPIR